MNHLYVPVLLSIDQGRDPQLHAVVLSSVKIRIYVGADSETGFVL